MVPINPNEAPEGYIAQSAIGWSCINCAFHSRDITTRCTAPDYPSCVALQRKDNSDVIFVKKESTT